MSKAGDSILRGMRDAVAHSRGEKSGSRTHTARSLKPIDVRRIRRRLKLSQTAFARHFGFSVATVRDWEQQRRSPVGPARVLLTVIDREPEAVRRAIRAPGRVARRAS